MYRRCRRSPFAVVRGLSLGLLCLGSAPAEETRVPGHLTHTAEQALYGEAILRSAPAADAPSVRTLVPGAKVTVYPDTSPPGWWFVEMALPDGDPVAGYVARNLVRSKKGPFSDVSGDHWAAAALHRLKATGELTGKQDGSFEGERGLTRFELAVLLDRAMTRLQETRAEVDRHIAELPARIAEAGERVKELDRLVPELDRLRSEEASLRAALETVQGRVESQGRALEEKDSELLHLVQKDRDQDRRLDELARAMASAGAEVAAARQRQGQVDPERELQVGLGETMERLERLTLAARVVEDRVEEAEASRSGM